MITFKLVLVVALIIIALPMYVIGLKNVQKSRNIKKNIGDIDAWKISIELAEKYPEEYKLIKRMSMSLGWAFLIMLFSIVGMISGFYTYIEYKDSTIIIVSCLIAIIGTVLVMLFSKKLLRLKLKIETNFKELADEENRLIISEYITSNQIALKGWKYTLPAFLLMFIVIFVASV